MASRRQTYTEQTRRALLDSARECFGARGFHGTSVGEIAASANISPGAVYKHFESKEQLFYEVAEEIQRELFEKISKLLSSLSDPRDRLTEARKAYLKACEQPGFLEIVYLDHASVVGDEPWRKKRPAYTVVLLRDLLGTLAAEGRLRVGSVDAAAHMIFGAISQAARYMMSTKPRRRAREEVNEVLELLEATLFR